MTAIHRTKRSIPILFVVHILSSVSIYKLEKGKVFSDYYMRLCAFAGGGSKKNFPNSGSSPHGEAEEGLWNNHSTSTVDMGITAQMANVPINDRAPSFRGTEEPGTGEFGCFGRHLFLPLGDSEPSLLLLFQDMSQSLRFTSKPQFWPIT